MGWAENAATMDTVVDDELGDVVYYACDGSSFTRLKAFVIIETEDLRMDGIDGNLGSRPRLKIGKYLVSTIEASHRIKAARLGEGTFKPGPDQPDEDDRYWIFDLMKVA